MPKRSSKTTTSTPVSVTEVPEAESVRALRGQLEEELRVLPRSVGERNPPLEVQTLLTQAQELLRHLPADAEHLLATGCDRRTLEQFALRTQWLEATEKTWLSLRDLGLDEGIREARQRCEEHKRQSMRLGWRFLRSDAAASAKLDAIAEGSGDKDLIQDLHDLAACFDTWGARLPATEQPGALSQTLRAQARHFEAVLGDRIEEQEQLHAARLERNRAFALLHLAWQELHEAARHAFRGVPTQLAPYATPVKDSQGRKESKPPVG